MLTIILAWVMVVLVILSLFTSIYMIGKPRQPTTPGMAIASLIVAAVQVYLFIWVLIHA